MAENNTRGDMEESDRISGINLEDLDLDQMDLVYLYVRKTDRKIQALENQVLSYGELLKEQLKEKDRQESDVSELEENIRKTQQMIIGQMNAREGARGAKFLLESKVCEVKEEIAAYDAESEERQRSMKTKLAHWKERFEKFQEHLRTFEDYRLYSNLVKEAQVFETENMEFQRRINELEDLLPKMEAYKVSGVAIMEQDKNFLAEYAAKWMKAPGETVIEVDGEDKGEVEMPQPTESSVISKETGIELNCPALPETADQINEILVSGIELSTPREEEMPQTAESSLVKEVHGVEADAAAIPEIVDRQDTASVFERSEPQVQPNLSTVVDEDAETVSVIDNDAAVLRVSTLNTARVNPVECLGSITPTSESPSLAYANLQTPNGPLIDCMEVDVQTVSEEADRSVFRIEAGKQNETVPEEVEVGVASTAAFKIPSLPLADISSASNVNAEPTAGTPNPQELSNHNPTHQFPDFSVSSKKSVALPPFRFPIPASPSANTASAIAPPLTAAGTVPCSETPSSVKFERTESEPAKLNQKPKSAVDTPKMASSAISASSRLSFLSFKLNTPKPSPKVPGHHSTTNTTPASTVNAQNTATHTVASNLNESLGKISPISGTHTADMPAGNKGKISVPLQFNIPKTLTPRTPSKLLTSATPRSIPSVSVPASPGISAPTAGTTKSPFPFAFPLNISKPQTPKIPSFTSTIGITTPVPSLPTFARTSASTTASTSSDTVPSFPLNFQLNMPKAQTQKIPVNPVALTTPSTPKIAMADTCEGAKSKMSPAPKLPSFQRNLIDQSPNIHPAVGVSIPSVGSHTTQALLSEPEGQEVIPSAKKEPIVFKTPQAPTPKASALPFKPIVENPAPQSPAFSFSPVASTSEKKADDKEAVNFFAAFDKLGADTEPVNSDGVIQPGLEYSSSGIPKSYLDFGTMGQFASENSDTQEFSMNDFFNMMPKAPSPDTNNDFRLSFQDDFQQSTAPFNFP